MTEHLISISEARAILPALVEEAQAGTEVYITKHGFRVARLVPIVLASALQWTGQIVQTSSLFPSEEDDPFGTPAFPDLAEIDSDA